ncbi:MAG: sensor histidine kinase [Pseudonocardia sp.]
MPWAVRLPGGVPWLLLGPALGVALLARRRAPVASVVAVQLLLPFWVMVAQPDWAAYQLLAWLASTLALGAYAPIRASVPAMAGVVAAWCVAAWALGAPSDGPAAVVLPLFVFGVGLLLRRYAEDRDRERRRAEQVRAEHELRERARVADERVRLARDLHDAVAHQITVMALTAGAVRRLLRPDQATERAALADVEQVGRRAVAEMHGIVHALRAGADPENEPAGLRGVHDLVEQARRAGATVDLEITGVDDSAVPPAVAATVFRVVQESLTNALRHAEGAPTVVRLTGSADRVEVEVRDRGGRRPGPASTGGVGLVGMRERVQMLGGRLQAGPADGAGWTVRAWLPVSGSES